MTAWLAPLPPRPRASPVPGTVSPGSGSRATRKVRSTFVEPMTTIDDVMWWDPASGRMHAAVLAAPAVVAVVEDEHAVLDQAPDVAACPSFVVGLIWGHLGL